MLKQQVLNLIEKYELINYGDGIVVGISGGYDSVCLLHILYSISSQFELKLYPVHVNHMLRGEEALRDENFVKEFCESLGLELYIKKIDIARKAQNDKISLEEAGRNARYDEFNRVALLNGASKIAVAHSRNDQAETILMRIFRGTGLEGLRGMEYKRDNIIRPLLDTDRKQIEEYVHQNGLRAIVDSSNLHTDYFRNRIRLNVIPEIDNAVGSSITENLLRLSKIVVADDDFLRYNSELYYQKSIVEKRDFYVELKMAVLLEMHQSMRNRVLRAAIYDVCGTLDGIGFVHIDSVLALIENGRTGARVDLPHGLVALKSYNSLIFKKQCDKKIEKFEEILKIPGETWVDNISGFVSAQKIDFETNYDCREFINKNENVYTKFIDFEKLKEKDSTVLVVRNRRNGDVFKPLKSIGTKKLKEYFIDKKVPRDDRDAIVLIASGSEVVWIVGDKSSDNYKVTDNTKSVLMIAFAYKKR